MSIDLANAKCQLKGCGGPVSGVCINALEFDECPDIIAGDAEIIALDAAAVETAEVQPSPLATNVGDSLDADRCDTVLRRTGAHLIGIVAGPEAGKTTLVATIYEMLHRGMIDNLGFAGSETLRGYEERAFLSRLASNSSKPDTERTKFREKLSFTHLRIAKGEERFDALFSDRSGEHFDNVVNKPADISGFEELARADRLWIVVDLQQLKEDGHVLKAHLRRVVMAMAASDLFDGKHVAVVATKADLFVQPEDLDAITASVTAFAQQLSSLMGGYQLSIELNIVSCRPKKGEFAFGLGIAGLMEGLFSEEEIGECRMLFPMPAGPSELDKIMLRLENAQ